ncbi:MAG TPA: DeoR/GlpR family DNA-binding transcription regulator [Candidatus Cybelea sp.]|nr:DeoR/GlpR family DNA-binding transcription regulator [Candidatus Cybelea sp.]
MLEIPGEGDGATATGSGRLPAGARQARLIELIGRSGFLSVVESAEQLGVSAMTIRRDLEALEAKGVLTRTHGGAVALPGQKLEVFDAVEPEFEQRRRRQATAKARIAAAAATLVKPNETIALDVGTSVLALAKALAGRPDLKFLTNNLPAAMALAGGRSPVYVLGGQLRAPEMAVIGAAANDQARSYYFDRAFIGVSGVIEGGFYDYSLEDSDVKRAFIERARQVVVLCDSSKFDHRALARISELKHCHVMVTEAAPPEHLARALADAGTEVVVA